MRSVIGGSLIASLSDRNLREDGVAPLAAAIAIRSSRSGTTSLGSGTDLLRRWGQGLASPRGVGGGAGRAGCCTDFDPSRFERALGASLRPDEKKGSLGFLANGSFQ